MTRRVHCQTCTCDEDVTPVRIDGSAPFFGLVMLIEQISDVKRREATRRTVAEHRQLAEVGDE